jgi:D-alanine-D-alanine ligase-like ATP-grasp enzyme
MKVKVKHIEGYAYGAIQPSAVISFSDFTSEADKLATQLSNLIEGLPTSEDTQRFFGDDSLFEQNTFPALFVTIIDILNRHCGDQRFTPIKVFQEGGSICFAVPTLSPAMISANSRAVQSLLPKFIKGMRHEQLLKFIDELRQRGRDFLPSGTNAGSFIAAAAERRIPFKIFSPRYIIFGYGSGSSIFNSSITDKESAVGVSLAKSKVDTNRLLKISGFPVAKQARVRKLEDAIIFANKTGYPVVLKPENEEQGRGVCTFLQTEQELIQTFKNLVKQYRSLIIEQHYFGDGYRVFVLNNEVVRVRKLEAAHVFGDGVLSILQLIDKENSSAERNHISGSMKKIIVDDDLTEMLKKQHLKLSDVPSSGQKVILVGPSNLSRGGKSIDFLINLHPENKLLCEQVTRTIGLYCSGVDLISLDASVPWHSNGAIVCEVNAQPQIGTDGKVLMHDQMICDAKITQLPVSLSVVNQTTESTASIFNKCADQLTIIVSAESILKSGCPVQYFDTLEIAGDVSEDNRQKVQLMLVSVPPEP